MSPFPAVEEGPRLVIKQRGGRLIAVARGGRRTWRIVAECLAMIGLSCCILACGGMIGFYSNQKVFDSQSQRFAEDSLTVLIPRWDIQTPHAQSMPDRVVNSSAGPPIIGQHGLKQPVRVVKGCFGQSRLELFNPSGFVFASYVCEVDVNGGLLLANLGLRLDPDAWKITDLYVDAPMASHP